MSNKKALPEWAPKGKNKEFATTVLSGNGITDGHDGFPKRMKKKNKKEKAGERKKIKRQSLSLDEYIGGVLDGNRMIIARAITLVESNVSSHMEMAQDMLKELLPHTGNSIRIGITGVPGAGKSTLIESLGNFLCDMGYRVAVLAIDPSSRITGGSILGDKTRMETLARRSTAFIRPSPTGGTLGGVTRKSRESLLVCEAAGYDIILVETVGVGQSEVAVRSMVDFFLLVLIAGAGDELQGMKRGIMELADTVIINKADGDNKVRAEAAKVELERILHYLHPATKGWTTEVHTCSSITGEGIEEIWDVIQKFKENTTESTVFERRRRNQAMEWVQTMAREYLERQFFENSNVRELLTQIKKDVIDGTLSPTLAVQKLIQTYEGCKSKP